MNSQYATVIFLALSAWLPSAQAEDACAAVPAGLKLESRARSGSLCADVLLKPGEEGTRQLRVFDAGQLDFTSEDAAMCKTCGGAMGDPFRGVKWNGTNLAVSNSGGSRESWDETWKFAKRAGGWVIIGWERGIQDRAAGSAWRESVNALSGKANAQYLPGGGKDKALKLSCAHPANSPAAGTVGRWREGAFACGLKTP
jgi:hypothetical protein